MVLLLIRLEEKLKNLKDKSQKALVAYLVAGDPDLDTSLELMHGFVEAGVDILEIGVPFTDPIAEGPIIQASHDRSLKNQTTLEKIFNLVEQFRKTDSETPIILMGYVNTFLAYKNELQSIHHRGTDALLIVDIPGESQLQDVGIINDKIASISLVSPTTEADRVTKICYASTGFIYYVTLRGVTGASNINPAEVQQNIEMIRSNTSLPVLAGFGIKTAEDARTLSILSDGVIIGSVLVEMIYQAGENKDYKLSLIHI